MGSVSRRPAGFPASAVVAATALALLGSPPACSLVFVKPPPPPEKRGSKVTCTSSDVAAFIDALLATSQMVRFAIAFASNDSDYPQRIE